MHVTPSCDYYGFYFLTEEQFTDIICHWCLLTPKISKLCKLCFFPLVAIKDYFEENYIFILMSVILSGKQWLLVCWKGLVFEPVLFID